MYHSSHGLVGEKRRETEEAGIGDISCLQNKGDATFVAEKPINILSSCQFLCETVVDGSSVLNPGVSGSVSRAGRSGEWDGPEATHINNASRHRLRQAAISHFVLNLPF